jgi:GNAT superfamily N-acetyltransferase
MSLPVLLRAALHPVSPAGGLRQLNLRSWWDRQRFARLSRRLHQGEPGFHPPLDRELRHVLDLRHSSLWEDREVGAWVVEGPEGLRGRILAWVDHAFDRVHGPGTGWFGELDADGDPEVLAELMAASRSFLAAHGATRMIGPVGPLPELHAGLLVEGRGEPPLAAMCWHPPGMAAQLEGLGMRPERDLLGWTLDPAQPRPGLDCRAARAHELGLSLKPVRMDRLEEELVTWQSIYNAARVGAWAATPLGHRQFEELAHELARLSLPELLLVAEAQGRPVGLCLSLPDWSQRLDCSGHLWPINAWRLLSGRQHPPRLRVLGLPVLPDFQMLGVEEALLSGVLGAAAGLGVEAVELCWTTDEDQRLLPVLRAAGARRSRCYRVFSGEVQGR